MLFLTLGAGMFWLVQFFFWFAKKLLGRLRASWHAIELLNKVLHFLGGALRALLVKVYFSRLKRLILVEGRLLGARVRRRLVKEWLSWRTRAVIEWLRVPRRLRIVLLHEMVMVLLLDSLLKLVYGMYQAHMLFTTDNDWMVSLSCFSRVINGPCGTTILVLCFYRGWWWSNMIVFFGHLTCVNDRFWFGKLRSLSASECVILRDRGWWRWVIVPQGWWRAWIALVWGSHSIKILVLWWCIVWISGCRTVRIMRPMIMTSWRAVVSEIILCKLLISLVHLIWDKLTVGSLGNNQTPHTLISSMLAILILSVRIWIILHTYNFKLQGYIL